MTAVAALDISTRSTVLLICVLAAWLLLLSVLDKRDQRRTARAVREAARAAIRREQQFADDIDDWLDQEAGQ